MQFSHSGLDLIGGVAGEVVVAVLDDDVLVIVAADQDARAVGCWRPANAAAWA
ncbi:hypothetical protein IU469_30980 [Nocardia puris]|uniref:hypothetical protein n=1 Tax=Nocardia puris TaxID=208602 RepID=UPI0018963000|nr:hypothetical protein [Nocardia puris]MBF6215918.1 hypothetical protein [Nocardia puris]MBF6370099.1 hypothetical protein [Nocardia puris]